MGGCGTLQYPAAVPCGGPISDPSGLTRWEGGKARQGIPSPMMGWAWAIVISVVGGGVAGGYGDWGGGGDEVVNACWVFAVSMEYYTVHGDRGEKRDALFLCSV